MKACKRIVSLFLAVGLLCISPVAAYAHEIPDMNREGMITVKMEYDGTAVSGGTLTAYQVGQIQEDNGNYSFAKTAAMENFSGDYGNISDSKLAEDLAVFVKKHSISAYATAENNAGTATFTNMKLGLYLIVQTEASDGYEPLKPFLVSLPMNEDGHYVYEVNAEGKFQLHQEPKPTSPSKPSDPTLPQTGQLNWPIPVLVITGLLLFAVGWLLCRSKKKEKYES